MLAFGNVVFTLALVQLVRWRFGAPHRASTFRAWIGSSQAWAGWPIFLAAAAYILSMLGVLIVGGR